MIEQFRKEFPDSEKDFPGKYEVTEYNLMQCINRKFHNSNERPSNCNVHDLKFFEKIIGHR